MSIWDIVLVCRRPMCLFGATVLYTDPLEGNSKLLSSGCSEFKQGMFHFFHFNICHMQQKTNSYNRLFQLYWESAQREQAPTGQARTTQVAWPAQGFRGVEGTGWLRILFSGLFMKLPGEQLSTLAADASRYSAVGSGKHRLNPVPYLGLLCVEQEVR